MTATPFCQRSGSSAQARHRVLITGVLPPRLPTFPPPHCTLHLIIILLYYYILFRLSRTFNTIYIPCVVHIFKAPFYLLPPVPELTHNSGFPPSLSPPIPVSVPIPPSIPLSFTSNSSNRSSPRENHVATLSSLSRSSLTSHTYTRNGVRPCGPGGLRMSTITRRSFATRALEPLQMVAPLFDLIDIVFLCKRRVS